LGIRGCRQDGQDEGRDNGLVEKHTESGCRVKSGFFFESRVCFE
jgi:hypothetical protein